MKIKRFINKQKIYGHRSDSVFACLELMQKNNLSCLPIVDEQMRVVGVITLGMLLDHTSKLSVESYLNKLKALALVSPEKQFASDEAIAFLNVRVDEVMDVKFAVVSVDGDIVDAINILLSNRASALPVVGAEGELVAVFQLADLLSVYTMFGGGLKQYISSGEVNASTFDQMIDNLKRLLYTRVSFWIVFFMMLFIVGIVFYQYYLITV